MPSTARNGSSTTLVGQPGESHHATQTRTNHSWTFTTRHTLDGAIVVALTCDIDHADGPCVLDLTSVRFLGAVALTTLVNAASHGEARSTPLRILVDANLPVIRPIQVMDLDDQLRRFHTAPRSGRVMRDSGRRGFRGALRNIYVGITRFEQLQQELGISRKVLTERLE
jgi:anti-sigma B factor antagonist